MQGLLSLCYSYCMFSECGNQMCMIKCPSGFKQDKQGCNLCECNPEVESGNMEHLSKPFVTVCFCIYVLKNQYSKLLYGRCVQVGNTLA